MRVWAWAGAVAGICVAVALVLVAVLVDLDTGDRVASVVGAVAGLAGCAVALVALLREPAADAEPGIDASGERAVGVGGGVRGIVSTGDNAALRAPDAGPPPPPAGTPSPGPSPSPGPVSAPGDRAIAIGGDLDGIASTGDAATTPP
ncbi:hypothetical protein AR457_33595 [Streptomyces agglomeratus]|uniref:Uncharacterized protein n=2 Tax=Streptomyces agglomeratus TaxID=285458 RepID=A0A1E5PGI3_9ACTN|nr:hypothetical protein AS594_33460 [Streptomyces agglomeratus]OEJ36131.1 hypothetical protein AR457_35595 [Streptomyces agglomeratus]OEJ37277.1 hypothetical protein BGK70_03075 [Streptomyces agglomeratus]OEJ48342.1 hypothetical protein AR457_33595 [Streptomyces agglomeratus]OEJ49826.1 hypothetical protein BGK72_02600 [Streptomyces agglomeratus]